MLPYAAKKRDSQLAWKSEELGEIILIPRYYIDECGAQEKPNDSV